MQILLFYVTIIAIEIARCKYKAYKKYLDKFNCLQNSLDFNVNSTTILLDLIARDSHSF